MNNKLISLLLIDNTGQQWMFTPDVIEAGVSKADMEDKIIKHIEELVDKEKMALAKEFGVNLSDKNLPEIERFKWDRKLDDLKKSIKGQGSDGHKFVHIYDYENITKVVE